VEEYAPEGHGVEDTQALAPVAEVSPDGQAVQADEEFAPGTVENAPAAQFVQLIAATLAVYFPAAHAVHGPTKPVVVLNVPSGQFVQAPEELAPDAAAEAYFPATHAVQVTEPVTEEKVPATQVEHAPVPVAENVPVGHAVEDTQALAPDADVCPKGQTVQEVGPTAREYVPTAQFPEQVAEARPEVAP